MNRQSLSVAIAEAIADVEGVAPTELDYSLHDYIDVTAIDKLAAHDSDWSLQFTVADHAVKIESDERIVVDGIEYQWNDRRESSDS